MIKVLKKISKKVKNQTKKNTELVRQNKKLKGFYNINKGKDCIILGAGPSLETLPHSFLEKFVVIGTNKSFKYYSPDYWVVVDAQFTWMDEGRKLCHDKDIPAFLNWVWAKEKPANDLSNEVNLFHNKIPMIQGPENTKLRDCILDLFRDPKVMEKKGISSISNVVAEAAIPLALYMGCRNIYLIGVDFYTPKEDNTVMKRSKEDQAIIDKITKRFQEEDNSQKDMWEYKRWTLELIKGSSIEGRVFNLSEKSSIVNIPKVHYSDVEPK